MSVTTIVITDPELLAKLAAASGQIIFRGPTGDTVKTAEVVANRDILAAYKCPYTHEQLDELSKNRTGRPIGDVLKDLKEKYGE
ncbi:MAG: hypothetical protein K8U57_37485 [Planctomycetes bacterium]|nr:hypothetical protein [Planctomycetota bacterium]